MIKPGWLNSVLELRICLGWPNPDLRSWSLRLSWVLISKPSWICRLRFDLCPCKTFMEKSLWESVCPAPPWSFSACWFNTLVFDLSLKPSRWDFPREKPDWPDSPQYWVIWPFSLQGKQVMEYVPMIFYLRKISNSIYWGRQFSRGWSHAILQSVCL